MAFISKQCVTCAESTKCECGVYHGSDEKGKYSGTLYECNNVCCKIYYSRVKPRTQHSVSEESMHVTGGTYKQPTERYNRTEKHKAR